MLQSVIIGLKECWGRGGGLEREGKPNNYPTKWFLFESWGGGGGGGGGGGATPLQKTMYVHL